MPLRALTLFVAAISSEARAATWEDPSWERMLAESEGIAFIRLPPGAGCESIRVLEGA